MCLGKIAGLLTAKTREKAVLQAQMRQVLASLQTVATDAEVEGYVSAISRLMGDDEYYARASEAARTAGLAHIHKHRGQMGAIVRGLWEQATHDEDA